MKEYITPEMKIKKLTFEDIVCTSGGGEGGVGTGPQTQDDESDPDVIDNYY